MKLMKYWLILYHLKFLFFQEEEAFLPNSTVCPRYTVAINCIGLMVCIYFSVLLCFPIFVANKSSCIVQKEQSWNFFFPNEKTSQIFFDVYLAALVAIKLNLSKSCFSSDNSSSCWYPFRCFIPYSGVRFYIHLFHIGSIMGGCYRRLHCRPHQSCFHYGSE